MTNQLSRTRLVPSVYIGRVSDGLMAMLFVGACYAIYHHFGNSILYLENGYFETVQNLLLFSGAAIFAVSAVRETGRFHQSVLWGLALFCVSVLVREVDVRGTKLEPYVTVISEYRIHYLVLSILWVGVLLRVFREMGATWRAAVQWLCSLPGAWFLAGIVLYTCGEVIEKALSNSDYNLAMMLEESVELLGTLFIFYAGYASLRRQVRLTNLQRMPSQGDGQ